MIQITNGRIPNDIEGEYTYLSRNCSVVDYLLYSDDVMNTIASFNVDNRTESPYMPLRCSYNLSNFDTERDELPQSNVNSRYRFDDVRSALYKQKICEIFNNGLNNTFYEQINANDKNITEIEK